MLRNIKIQTIGKTIRIYQLFCRKVYLCKADIRFWLQMKTNLPITKFLSQIICNPLLRRPDCSFSMYIHDIHYTCILYYFSKNISRETVPISKWLLLSLLWEASSFTKSMHLLNFSGLLWEEKMVLPTLEPYRWYQQHLHELSCNIDSLVGA